MTRPSLVSAHRDPFVIHIESEMVYANDPCLALVGGQTPDAVIGRSVSAFVAEPFYQPLAEQFEQLSTQQADALGLSVEIEPLDRPPHECVIMSSPVEWDGKRAIQSTFLDVSADATDEPVFTRAMNAAPIGISIADATDDDTPLIYVSDGFCRITGYGRSDVVGRNCRFLQGPDTRPEPVAAMREAIAAEEPVTVTLRNYRVDGTMFWNRVTITPVANTAGEVTHFLGYQEDVSQQKLYEHEKTLFEKQADAAPYAMFITDRSGSIEYVNPAFEELTGYTAAEALGENPRILKSNQQDDSFYDELWETITAGETWEDELVNRTKSGELFRVQQTIVPIQNADGEITHFAAIERDISETAFTDQVLDVINRILRHNLRTSINVIDGYATLLEETLEGSDEIAAAAAISDRTRRLETLSEKTTHIRNLMERRSEKQLVDLPTIINYIDQCRRNHPEAAISLTNTVTDDIAIKNGSLLQLAIEESIENSVIHNDDGQPRIEITFSQSTDPPQLCIEIADNGSGIPQTEWDVITANQETPLQHSSGIGLWLIYWSITSLGGTVDLTRHGSYGSVLTYRLPVVDAPNSDS